MKRPAFTLIELLVVIAIIGLLSTFSVVQLAGAREKARIAKGLSFSQDILSGVGENLVGRWDFDECTGTTANDTSGLGNSATVISTPAWNSDTPSGRGCVISLSGSSYVDAGNAGSLNIPSGGSVTMCVWIKPSSSVSPGYRGIVAKRDTSAVPFAYGINYHTSGQFNIYTSGPSGIGSYVYVPPNDKWTHICGVISATERTRLYVNGSLYGEAGSAGGVASNSADVTMGISYAAAEPFIGDLDDVRIYAASLTGLRIQKIFASSIKKYSVYATLR